MKYTYSNVILEPGYKENTILFEDYTVLGKIPDKEHAQNIVRILRNHDSLLEAAKELIRQLDFGFTTQGLRYTTVINDLKQAIQKAEGK